MATLREEKSDGSPRAVGREGECEGKTGSKGEVKRSLLHLPDDEINAILDRTLITMSPDAFDKFVEILDGPSCPDRVSRIKRLFAKKAPWE